MPVFVIKMKNWWSNVTWKFLIESGKKFMYNVYVSYIY